MKFFAGCLVGGVVGVLLAIGAFLVHTSSSAHTGLELTPLVSADNPDLTITLSEAYLNAQLRAGVATRGLDASDLSINLHAPNRADATMTFQTTVLNQSISLHPNISFHFGVSKGLVTLAVDKINISGISVPNEIVNQQVARFQRAAEDIFNAEVKRLLANTGLRLVSVEATENVLIIKLAR